MLKPLIELVIAGALWGFAFTATAWTLKGIDVPALLFYRFAAATVFGLLPLLVMRKTRVGLWSLIKSEGRTAWRPGVWLFLTIAFQAFGMLTTTATKSAFITTLYVVMVPFAALYTGQDKMRMRHFVWVALALIGVALFQDLEINNWSIGDTLTLGAAAGATFHILSVAKWAPLSKSPYILNLWQMFWSAALAPLLFMFGPRWDLRQLDGLGIFGLLMMIFGAGLIAFYFQVRAQEKIPPNLASLLFLLESPFSALFAFWLLHERFTPLQWLGGAVILAACAAAILTEAPKTGPAAASKT